MTLPTKVRLVEVGPRDGLQNEPQLLGTELKVELIAALGRAGLRTIEATSFVSPKWIPQMADNAAVMARIVRLPGVSYPVLTPNLKGFKAALAAGATEVAVFAAASESFSQRNINCSIAESLGRFEPLMQAAIDAGVRVRGYVSCVLGCPYEGAIEPRAVAAVAAAVGSSPRTMVAARSCVCAAASALTRAMLEAVSAQVPVAQLAGHFHDTYGMAIANIYASLESGVAVFDAAIAGLGGCPYAAGASGNVASEDVVYLLHGMGIDTGIDLERLMDCSVWICGVLGRRNGSRVTLARRAAAPQTGAQAPG